ncbi:MAG: glycerate kinase [Geodermatophilaceae bacterium]|nr:glycerate kinase [Geodermatophilaceae bacterium]
MTDESHVDLAPMLGLLNAVTIVIASDVRSPLTGEGGAAVVFGPRMGWPCPSWPPVVPESWSPARGQWDDQTSAGSARSSARGREARDRRCRQLLRRGGS